MSIVQDRRQQDGIASARLDRKSTEALWEDGGERKEGSPTYLRIVGRKKDRNIHDMILPEYLVSSYHYIVIPLYDIIYYEYDFPW